MSITNDVYGHSVTMTTDGTIDTYVVGGSLTYTFPAGTSDAVVSLTLAIQANILMFMAQFNDFMNNHYTVEIRVRLIGLYLATQGDILHTNRFAYLGQLMTWTKAVSAYATSYIATLNAQTDPNVVATLMFDQTQFAADPAITVLGAMSIPN